MMKELRQLPNMTEVPAIALSGYVSQKDTRMALDAGSMRTFQNRSSL
jgi:CheY-like chemotaxis protein